MYTGERAIRLVYREIDNDLIQGEANHVSIQEKLRSLSYTGRTSIRRVYRKSCDPSRIEEDVAVTDVYRRRGEPTRIGGKLTKPFNRKSNQVCIEEEETYEKN